MGKQLYKTTQFCYTIYNEKNELLIFNTFTGKMLKVSPDKAQDVKTLMEKESKAIKTIYAQILCNEKILVPVKADEIAFLQASIHSYINQSELGLMILPTHQCNCRCVYCYENFKSGTMTKSVQNNLFRFVKERLNECSAMDIAWFGGEPLMALDVIRELSPKFINYCKKVKKRYSASMTTNGTLLTLETFKELLNYKIVSYQITIDGIKNTHDQQRPLSNGKSSYDLIIKNLLDIKKEYKHRQFFILLRINLTKLSLKNIEEYIEELSKLFGNDSRFRLHFNVAADWGGKRIHNFSNCLLKNEDDISDKIKGVIASKGHGISIQKIDSQYGVCKFNPGCYVGYKNYFTVDSTGYIYKCAQTIRYGIKPIGNLNTNPYTIDEYEYSKWYNIANNNVIPSKCKNCFLLPTGCYRDSCVVRMYETAYLKNNLSEKNCPKLKKSIKEYMIELDKNGEYKLIS